MSVYDGRSKTKLYKSWVSMKRRCDNPIQMLKNLIMNKQINNPILKEVINKAQNGDSKSVEQFARNLFKEQGRNYDEEFNNFCNQFGFKK